MIGPNTHRSALPRRSPRAGIFIVLAGLLFSGSACPAAQLKSVTLESKPYTTRVVLELDTLTGFHDYNQIAERNLFYLDVEGIDSDFSESSLPKPDGLVRHLKAISFPEKKVLRIVFYPSAPASYILSTAANPSRIVVDMVRSDGETLGGADGQVETRAAPAAQVVFARNGPPEKLIVIDPGHGGDKFGTQSQRRFGGRYLRESDLALQIAKRLERLIEKAPNQRAIMTRYADSDVSLLRRIDIATASKGDLFVSIHLNDSGDPKRRASAKGMEIYFLNEYGSRQESTQALERLENEEEVDLTPKGSHANLKTILKDLAQTTLDEQKAASRRLAQYIEHSALRISYVKKNYRGIKDANFRVLKNFEMPAILVECGFLTNYEESGYLNDPAYQQRLAIAIFNGINLYLAERNPSFQPYQYPLN